MVKLVILKMITPKRVSWEGFVINHYFRFSLGSRIWNDPFCFSGWSNHNCINLCKKHERRIQRGNKNIVYASQLWLLICSKNTFLYSMKIYLYSIKYICIQSKIFVFNEKYFYSILLLLYSIKNHTRTLFQIVGYQKSFANVQLTV